MLTPDNQFDKLLDINQLFRDVNYLKDGLLNQLQQFNNDALFLKDVFPSDKPVDARQQMIEDQLNRIFLIYHFDEPEPLKRWEFQVVNKLNQNVRFEIGINKHDAVFYFKAESNPVDIDKLYDLTQNALDKINKIILNKTPYDLIKQCGIQSNDFDVNEICNSSNVLDVTDVKLPLDVFTINDWMNYFNKFFLNSYELSFDHKVFKYGLSAYVYQRELYELLETKLIPKIANKISKHNLTMLDKFPLMFQEYHQNEINQIVKEPAKILNLEFLKQPNADEILNRAFDVANQDQCDRILEALNEKVLSQVNQHQFDNLITSRIFENFDIRFLTNIRPQALLESIKAQAIKAPILDEGKFYNSKDTDKFLKQLKNVTETEKEQICTILNRYVKQFRIRSEKDVLQMIEKIQHEMHAFIIKVDRDYFVNAKRNDGDQGVSRVAYYVFVRK